MTRHANKVSAFLSGVFVLLFSGSTFADHYYTPCYAGDPLWVVIEDCEAFVSGTLVGDEGTGENRRFSLKDPTVNWGEVRGSDSFSGNVHATRKVGHRIGACLRRIQGQWTAIDVLPIDGEEAPVCTVETYAGWREVLAQGKAARTPVEAAKVALKALEYGEQQGFASKVAKVFIKTKLATRPEGSLVVNRMAELVDRNIMPSKSAELALHDLHWEGGNRVTLVKWYLRQLDSKNEGVKCRALAKLGGILREPMSDAVTKYESTKHKPGETCIKEDELNDYKSKFSKKVCGESDCK